MNNRRVLVFGADGLRPDMITEQLMPNVSRLRKNGVEFSNFQATYPSVTRVSAATFSTGTTPGRHGINGNLMIVPGAGDGGIVNTEEYEHLDSIGKTEGGPTLLVETMSDVVGEEGGRVAVVGTGSNGHNALWTYGDRGRIINPNTVYGIPDLYAVREKLGPIPPFETPHYGLNDWATRATTEMFIPDPNLSVIVLWITEPDGAMHWHGIGSQITNEALQDVDQCLGRVLDSMDSLGVRDQFDILFTSDHGHSTVKTHKSLGDFFQDAKRDIGADMPELATAGDYVYAKPGSETPGRRQLEPLITWLLGQEWVDLVMTGADDLDGLPGTIPLQSLWNGHAAHRNPLFAVSPAWSEEQNEFGFKGTIAGLSSQFALKSTHGTLCPYDLNATLIASGPSFEEGVTSENPCGLVDIAPTILHLLEARSSATMDGRVLLDGMTLKNADVPQVEMSVIEPNMPDARARGVTIATVGDMSYLLGSAYPKAAV